MQTRPRARVGPERVMTLVLDHPRLSRHYFLLGEPGPPRGTPLETLDSDLSTVPFLDFAVFFSL